MKFSKLIYLASPYSHPNPDTVRHRVAQTQTAAAKLIEAGNLIFSPIIHSDPIHDIVRFDPHNRQGELSEWLEYDKAFISKCDEVWVLMLDGWASSIGVNAEVAYASSKGITKRYISYPGLKEVHTTTEDAAPEPETRRFKVGDIVRVTKECACLSNFAEGQHVRILSLDDNSCRAGSLDGEEVWYVAYDYLEAVEPEDAAPEPKPAKLVGLTGHAQVGKDTAGKYLVEEHGFVRIGLADAVKDAVYALNPIYRTNDGAHYPHLDAYVDQHGWDVVKTKCDSARKLLQRMGTEVGRNIFGENCWIDIAERKIKALGPDAKVVITDVRFPNEAEWVRSLGGEVWEVRRDGFGPVNDHASDQKLDADLIDKYVHNVWDVKSLESIVRTALKSYGCSV